MMKKMIFSSIALLGVFVLASCVKTDDVVEETSSLWYHTAANHVTIGGDETQADFQITSDCPWHIETEADSWVSVQPQTGNGTQRVTVVAASTNPSSTETRSSSFVIVTQDGVRKRVTVEQSPSTEEEPPTPPTPPTPPIPILDVTPSSMTIGAIESNAHQITITSNQEWTATCDAEWVHFSTSPGTGNATLTLTFDKNANITVRIATLTISADSLSRQVTITQEAGHLQTMGATTIEDVDETEARLSGSLIYTEFPVTEFGFYISTEANPSETGEKWAATGTLQAGDTFSVTVGELNKKTHYYVCAYATTDMGTVYSNVVDFETLSIPKEGDLNKPKH